MLQLVGGSHEKSREKKKQSRFQIRGDEKLRLRMLGHITLYTYCIFFPVICQLRMSLYLIMALLVVGSTAHLTDFSRLILTGRKTLASSGSPMTNDVILNSPFDQLNSNYRYALSFRHLQLNSATDANSGRYAMALQGIPSNNRLTINWDDSLGKGVEIKVLYLIVSPQFPYLSVYYCETPSNFATSPYPLDKYQVYNLTLAIPSTSSTSMLYTFVSGFDIKKNSVNNLTFQTETIFNGNTSLTTRIENNLNNDIKIYFLNLTVVVYDKQGMTSYYHYQFTTDNALAEPSSGSSSDYQTYNNATIQDQLVFYGVTGIIFKNINDDKLHFHLTTSDHQLSIENDNGLKVDLAFLIFTLDIPCDPTMCWNVTSNICLLSADNIFTNSSGECEYCPDHCLTCTNSTLCISCSPFYSISNSSGLCQPNCSLITPGCQSCDLDNIICTGCLSTYRLVSDTEWDPICGDGILVDGEECDDNNTKDGDGCSSLCLRQEHFLCDNSLGQRSICYLENFSLDYQCVVKDPAANSFTATFQLTPQGIQLYQQEEWAQTIRTCQDLTMVEATYDSTESKLRVTFDYDQNWETLSTSISTNYSSLSDAFRVVKAESAQKLKAENNLSLSFYSENQYNLAMIVKYLSYVMAALAILFFLIGNFGAKLMALEGIAVFQLVALLQFNLTEMSPTFDSLFPLSGTLGITSFLFPNHYYESSSLPPSIKAQIPSKNPFLSINVFLICLLFPLVVGLILRCLSKQRGCRRKTIYQKAWKNCFGTFTFYSLLFLAYGEVAILAANLLNFQLSLLNGVAIVFGVAFVAALVVYVISSYKYAHWFGSFKNKFQKFTISQHFYTFSAAERIVTPVIILCASPNNFTGAFVCIPLLFECLLILIKRPYLLGVWKRPFLNKLVSIFVCLVYFSVTYFKDISVLALYGPFAILALLTIVLVVGICSSLSDIREFKQDMESKWKMPCTTKECNDYLEKEMTKKIMINLQDNPFKHIHQDLGSIKLTRSKWDWENYTVLYSINMLDVMKKKVQSVNQEEEGQEKSFSNHQLSCVYDEEVEKKIVLKGPLKQDAI